MKTKLLIFFFAVAGFGFANGPKAQEAYIAKYKDVAIHEMKEYGIPASITLAQGLLESGSGQSYLATEANNHFGIKCHLDWDGRKVYKDDDRRNECFRAYDDPDDSFRDHSLFLTTRSRYAFLFEESPTDYKAWAKGLKKAGYATNRKYDDRLIDLIERYELHQFDLEGYDAEPDEKEEEVFAAYQINVSKNRVKYIIPEEGDTFELIAEATDRRVEDLLKYNELSYDTELTPGQRLYLQPKRRKAARDHKFYVVQEGDDMYSVSQKFGVKLEKLYERNEMRVGEQPAVGQKLELR